MPCDWRKDTHLLAMAPDERTLIDRKTSGAAAEEEEEEEEERVRRNPDGEGEGCDGRLEGA